MLDLENLNISKEYIEKISTFININNNLKCILKIDVLLEDNFNGKKLNFEDIICNTLYLFIEIISFNNEYNIKLNNELIDEFIYFLEQKNNDKTYVLINKISNNSLTLELTNISCEDYNKNKKLNSELNSENDFEEVDDIDMF